MQPLILAGIMTGTSCDGIDTAFVRMPAPPSAPELLGFHQAPMPDRLREPILRLAAPGMDEIDAMGQLHMALGEAYAEAYERARAAAGIEAGQVLAIGLHGQTIRHRPGLRHPFSLQIGSAAVLAERTGRTVVSGFRERDIAAGGQGAPLVPFAHRRFLADSGADVAVVNIGGMANITFLGADGTTLGFDTGPGNALMDALMVALTDGRAGMDENGELAAAGSACDELLDRLMAHPFFRRRPPKSTGREDFGYEQLDLLLGWPGLSDADRMATALELTARTIADAGRFLPRPPARWLICGGGSRNRTLMQRLATLLDPAPVAPTDRYGLPAAAIEAASFAVLAWEALRGRPNTLASVTGAARDVVGGMISPGANWPEIVRLIGSWTR